MPVTALIREEMHERGAIGGRADALLGHLGPGGWAHFKQP
jgi:hypothetical protein